MRRTLKMIRNQTMVIAYLIVLFIVVVTTNKSTTITTNNVTSISSVKAVNLVFKYNPEEVETKVIEQPKTIQELAALAKLSPIKFKGTMTGYGPDCVGCSKNAAVSCPPNPLVSKKITYDDKIYGSVRILAADRSIPCGSIAIVRGSTEGEFIGIVLDRGGAIKGTLMDLLFKSESVTHAFGRQNVEYEIIRWGW